MQYACPNQQDEHSAELSALIEKHRLDAALCSKSAERYGIKPEVAQTHHFSIGGLALLIEAFLASEAVYNISAEHMGLTHTEKTIAGNVSQLTIHLETKASTGFDLIAVAMVLGLNPVVCIPYRSTQTQKVIQILEKLDSLKEYGILHPTLVATSSQLQGAQGFIQTKGLKLPIMLLSDLQKAKHLRF